MQYNHAMREARMKTGQEYQCSITERLDSIRMTPAERAAAKTYLRQGVRVADMDCHPPSLSGKTYYQPTDRGFEETIRQRIDEWKRLRKK